MIKSQKTYKIDISKASATERLADFFNTGWPIKTASTLALQAYKDIQQYTPKLAPLIRLISGIGFKVRGTGELGYSEEIKEWASHSDLSESYFAAANLGYELSQMGSWAQNQANAIWQSVKGRFQFCSSVALYRPGIGMVHCRNLDWPLKGFRKATVLIDYVNGSAGDFTAVSVPGMVGVLSGVAKGRFSATINQAPATGILPNLTTGWSALFLLRYAFETCESYEDAVELLSNATTIVPVFIQVVGAKRGQACVIEVMPRGDNYYWEFDGSPLAITNHEPGDEEYEDIGDDVDGWTDSIPRLDKITQMANKCKAKSLNGCFGVLKGYPVWGDNTQQSMVMCARTGEVVLQ